MPHLLPEQNERLREEMESAIKETYKTRARLAKAMGVAAPSLSQFLNRKGGASVETAEMFAQRIAKRPLIEIIGPRKIPPVPKMTEDHVPLPGFPVHPSIRQDVAHLLRRGPHPEDDHSIELGFKWARLETAADAKIVPKAVAAVKMAISGEMDTLPKLRRDESADDDESPPPSEPPSSSGPSGPSLRGANTPARKSRLARPPKKTAPPARTPHQR